MRAVDSQTAWANIMRLQAGKWGGHTDRFSDDVVDIHHEAKFKIDTDARFFCIGSCFARNIEEHLIYCGIDVLSRRIISPKKEWSARPNGIVNKFTTHSMRNEIEWILNCPTIDQTMFEERADGWMDLQLIPVASPVPLERAIERRTYLTCDYFSRMRDASIIVLTLGLNEVWFDHATGRHLNAPPSFYSARREPGRYELHITDFNDNLSELTTIHALIAKINPAARIVVTVSPVPLTHTFSGNDILVANMYSKSTLRAAAEVFANTHDNVVYYPTYEIVAMSPRATTYAPDCVHVTDRVVGRLMQGFLKTYLGLEQPPEPFNEIAYMEANPDVDAAVRKGDLGSGFEHWTLYGRREGRALTPADGPTPFMIGAGAV